jgi:fructose transport system ATP-binding protein
VFRRGRLVANLVKNNTSGEEVVQYITGAKQAQEMASAA